VLVGSVVSGVSSASGFARLTADYSGTDLDGDVAISGYPGIPAGPVTGTVSCQSILISTGDDSLLLAGQISADGTTMHGEYFAEHSPALPFGDAGSWCVIITSENQLNSDAVAYDAPPVGPSPSDDVTVPGADASADLCDADDDNDWWDDDDEPAGCNGSGPLNPLVSDTDGDRVLDGAECLLGSNPGNAVSKPGPRPGDADGDGLGVADEPLFGGTEGDSDSDDDMQPDGREAKGFGSALSVKDTDGDGVCDAQEIASNNGDTVVNNTDLLGVALHFPAQPAGYHFVYDGNRDGVINNSDLLVVALQLATNPMRCMLP
jgi:hypothetical protein